MRDDDRHGMHDEIVIRAGAWIGSHVPETTTIVRSVIALPAFVLASRLVLRALHAGGEAVLLRAGAA